ncbi:hypothetical protein Bbelb_022940 [Branchiostoma belcheri]|nr:hypothetical protein Bbelb_022940 [Branchiostoma belcheri]
MEGWLWLAQVFGKCIGYENSLAFLGLTCVQCIGYENSLAFLARSPPTGISLKCTLFKSYCKEKHQGLDVPHRPTTPDSSPRQEDLATPLLQGLPCPPDDQCRSWD